MNDALLLQLASNDYTRLLDLTYPHHSKYAAEHKMDYWCMQGRLQSSRHPFWDKIMLIQFALMFPQYHYIIWLDADVLIGCPEQDLREALPEGKWLAMVQHSDPPHANAGSMYLRNTPKSQAFFDRVWNQWPVDHPWEDQEGIRRTLSEASWKDGMALIPARWNSTFNENWTSDAVILAWHGYYAAGADMETKIAAMQSFGHEQLDAITDVEVRYVKMARALDCVQQGLRRF